MYKWILSPSIQMTLAIGVSVFLMGCQRSNENFEVVDGVLKQIVDEDVNKSTDEEHGEHVEEWQRDDVGATEFVVPFACNRASVNQIAFINQGSKKATKFMQSCWAATNNSRWCEELVRPNPASRATFTCTYGVNQPHQLIHPDETTWKNAFQAVNLIEELQASGISVKQIYNWWRPEPYNKNVGGAAGRHSLGSSVDVRFTSMGDMSKAHSQLCKWRAKGRLRALGFYGSTALHFGIGDTLANTWGKACQ